MYGCLWARYRTCLSPESYSKLKPIAIGVDLIHILEKTLKEKEGLEEIGCGTPVIFEFVYFGVLIVKFLLRMEGLQKRKLHVFSRHSKTQKNLVTMRTLKQLRKRKPSFIKAHIGILQSTDVEIWL